MFFHPSFSKISVIFNIVLLNVPKINFTSNHDHRNVKSDIRIQKLHQHSQYTLLYLILQILLVNIKLSIYKISFVYKIIIKSFLEQFYRC